jgi:serine/threonine-protein kinase
MPDWVGDPFTQVRIEADTLGLEIDEEREFSDEVEQGRVISTDPAEGEDVSRGDTVTVVVSRGAEEVEVPRLIGQTRDEARDLLTEVGLRLGRVTEEPSSQPAGTVLRSNPAEGVSVERGEQVDIVLSSGPTPSPEPTPTLQPTPPPTPPPTPTPEPTPTQTATI